MGIIINFTDIYTRDGAIMCTILKEVRNLSPGDLFEKYSIAMQPPIDISLLLEKIGISIIAKDFTEIEKMSGVPIGSILGAAFSNGNDLAIFYKESDTLHRKRFTIAHELAHCCYDCPNDESTHIQYRLDAFLSNSNDEENKQENRANIFAGELLIPETVLMPIYNQFIIPSLNALSKIFCVSANVMEARLNYLGLNYYKDTNASEE